MSRLETIVYECDWCKDRVPSERGGYSCADGPPEIWREYDGDDLCPACQTARAEALSYARHRRLNKWPLAMDESKPVEPSSVGEKGSNGE